MRHASGNVRLAASFRAENQMRGLRTTEMVDATTLARHVRSEDPRHCRDNLLGNTSSVKKTVYLHNLPVQEPIYEDDVSQDEKKMVQEVLEASLHTYLSDEKKRKEHQQWSDIQSHYSSQKGFGRKSHS